MSVEASKRDILVSIIMAGRDDDYGKSADERIVELTFTPISYINQIGNPPQSRSEI